MGNILHWGCIMATFPSVTRAALSKYLYSLNVSSYYDGLHMLITGRPLVSPSVRLFLFAMYFSPHTEEKSHSSRETSFFCLLGEHSGCSVHILIECTCILVTCAQEFIGFDEGCIVLGITGRHRKTRTCVDIAVEYVAE